MGQTVSFSRHILHNNFSETSVDPVDAFPTVRCVLTPFIFTCTRNYTCCLELRKLYKVDSQDDYE